MSKKKKRGVAIPSKVLVKLLSISPRKSATPILLYLLYLRKATKKQSNQIYCSNEQAVEQLGRNVGTISGAKRYLVEMGIITTIRKRKKGKQGLGKSYINIDIV